MTIVLGKTDVDRCGRIVDILSHYEPVDQQKILELCVARFIMHVSDDVSDHKFVADSFAKHVRQILGFEKSATSNGGEMK